MKDRFFLDDLPQNIRLFIGRTLQYAIKSPDMALFDFGFSKLSILQSGQPSSDNKGLLVLHISSAFKIIWNDKKEIEVYGDSTVLDFEKFIQPFIGATVRRCTLSEKNDLWFDFGFAYLVVVTFEDSEESWRIFFLNDYYEHIVATNSWLGIE